MRTEGTAPRERHLECEGIVRREGFVEHGSTVEHGSFVKRGSFRRMNSIRRRLFTLSACALIVLGVCAPNMVQAQQASGSLDVSAGRDPIAIYKQAGIDKDQEAKIREMASDYEKISNMKAREVFDRIHELRALTLEPDLNEKKVLQTQADLCRLQTEMAMGKIHLLIKIREVLNKEQRQHLVKLMETPTPRMMPKAAPDDLK